MLKKITNQNCPERRKPKSGYAKLSKGKLGSYSKTLTERKTLKEIRSTSVVRLRIKNTEYNTVNKLEHKESRQRGSEARMKTGKYNTLATRQGKTKTIYT